jgi:hypothetical protein
MRQQRNGPMWVYVSLSVIGLVGTAWFNIQGVIASQGSVLSAWFANPATSSLSVDLLVTASAASVFMVLEGRRIGVRWYWLYVLAAFVTAVGFTFPLFLAIRERRMNQ